MDQLTRSSNNLNTKIPNVVSCGLYISTSLCDISKKKSGKCVNTLQQPDYGMASVYVCENAKTKQFHTEMDCAYTMIISPKFHDTVDSNNPFSFQFLCDGEASGGKIIEILLSQGTTIYYNGYGICHHQTCLQDNSSTKKTNIFWNISCYTNKRLFDHTIQSMILLYDCLSYSSKSP